MERSPIRKHLEFIAHYEGSDVQPLALLVQAIRPGRQARRERQVPGLHSLIRLLRADEGLRQGLEDYIARLLEGKRLSPTILDSGMTLGDFWFELRERLIYKLLPYQPEKDTVEYILVNVFHQGSDREWLGWISDEDLRELMALLGGVGLDQLPVHSHWVNELVFSAKALALRIAGRAFDSGVLRMVPEYANFESPFVALEAELDHYLNGLRDGSIPRYRDHDSFRQVMVLLGQGEELVESAYRNSGKYGISFRVNQHLMMLERMLQRLRTVLHAIALERDGDGLLAAARLAHGMIRTSSGSTRVKGFLDRSTQVIAREITQHTGRKGEHYITTTRADYFKMLRTALGGGFVVAFACIIKAWSGTWEVSPFGQAFIHSLNYAGAFITIYLLHWTLATKQPAMTAATLAAALDKSKGRKGRDRYEALTDLMARVWRSQFIAFVGNVFMAFPVAVALGYAWNHLFGPAMLTAKSAKLIHELDPFTSLAILHAGFAGVFLFLSGLIAGNANNRSLVRRIPQRIAAHPGLRNIMAKGMRLRLAAWYERNFGGIISNLWFGIFMGSLGTVGMILGLPLDIRHITFAAGNFALGLVGNDWQIGLWPLIASILGIGIIGFINFIVSFTLSLALAMRSRGIPYSQLLPIARAVWRHHRKVPQAYYFPPAVVPEEPSGGRVEAGDLPDGDRTVARMREQDGKDGDGTTPQGP